MFHSWHQSACHQLFWHWEKLNFLNKFISETFCLYTLFINGRQPGTSARPNMESRRFGIKKFVFVQTLTKWLANLRWNYRSSKSDFFNATVSWLLISLGMSSSSNINCCVPLCNQRGTVDANGKRVGFFNFPKDPNLRAQWLQKIQRVGTKFKLTVQTFAHCIFVKAKSTTALEEGRWE